MAESLIVHFASATPGEVSRWLDYRLGGGANGTWCVPGGGSYYVRISPFTEYRREFDPEELEQLSKLVGSFPSCGLDLELRRSAARAAHDAAVELAAHLLREFPGVLQDMTGYEFWTLADIEAGVAVRAGQEHWPDGPPAR